MLNYSFIVPIINNGQQIHRQLASIPASAAPSILMLIDNSDGKDASVKTYLAAVTNENYPNLAETRIIIHDANGNLGCSGGWNFGITHTPGPWIIANSDVFLNDETPITETLKHLETNDFVISCWLSLFGMNRSCVDMVGLFDENFWPAYDEDLDYVTRLSLAKGKIYLFGANVIHEHSTAIRSDPKLRQLIGKTHGMNDQYFIRKWGSKNPNEFVGPQVYGSYTRPFNNDKLPLSYWAIDEDMMTKKKELYKSIMQ